ncbi:MAG: 3-phosphoshikimate 1-carboxyvinyltransferase [Candidatus Sumerlaeia bacterium]|nr:3-phosphoshikimate 1-carboxyvinyltransferase [Candidatus Sumerlaeia bacterium]
MNATLQAPSHPLKGIVNPPSSKNYTTRVILASCLAKGTSRVNFPAVQDDAVALVNCCRKLGATITSYDHEGQPVAFQVENATRINHLVIEGFGNTPAQPEGNVIDPDNAGAVLRLLLGTVCLCPSPVRVETAHYPHSLGKRPNIDLVQALTQLGVTVTTPNPEGTLPLVMSGGQAWRESLLAKGPRQLTLSGSISSQYLSSLLYLCPLLPVPVEITITNGLKSKPLIRTTLEVLKEAGVTVEARADLEFFRTTPQSYRPRTWTVGGDWPGVCSVLAAAAVVPGSDITVQRMMADEQGEQRSVEFYRAMGCQIEWNPANPEASLRLIAPEKLLAAEIDGDKATDGVLAMMSAAACAQGVSVFSGINNLQYKECDRVREPIEEMKSIFANQGSAAWEPNEQPEIIRVQGSPKPFETSAPVTVDGRGDHRVIMLLSVMALHSKTPVTITGAHHVAKSFPRWFATLEQLGVKVTFE